MRDITVGSNSIAELLGLSVRRVQELAKDGIISARQINGKYKYNLFDVAKEYIQYLDNRLKQQNQEKGDEALATEKLRAEVDLKKAQALKAQLELQELENTMHRAEDVESMTTDMVLAARSGLLSLPGLMAVDLAGIDTASEVAEYIKKRVHEVLTDLAHYEYNPEEYARRVRERQGWQERSDESE